MDLTAEQRALRDAVRALLAREQRRAAVAPDPGPPAGSAAGPAARSPATTDSAGLASPSPTPPGHDLALWPRLGKIGVAGLGVPERYGGAGAGPVETHIVAEELGRHLTPSPGAARQALDLTVAYTKVRVQFGRAIGGFQALAHRMADLHVLVESARSLSYAAAQAAAGQAPDTGLRAAAAKVYCSETLQRVAAEMIQLHGAIGITWEHGAHRYLKRAHGAAQLFGRPGEHAARIAAALIDH